MKHTITFIVLFLISFVYSNANSQTLNLGADVGVNIANISTTFTSTTTDSRTGIIAGAILEISAGKSWNIFSVIRYRGKGYKVESGSNEADYKLGYLEFPVLSKYNFILSEVSPFLNGGTSLGLNLTAERENPDRETSNFKSEVLSFVIGLLFDAGVDFKMAKSINHYIQLAYSWGLLNFNKRPGSIATAEHNGIQITSGVLFNLSSD